ncbi:hypothetical protein DFH09DRAFT_1099445 [Mycena vulgaris]|nr:hypothetical protein DFH09DRAFT_1099445 [Mycena vulgaris]
MPAPAPMLMPTPTPTPTPMSTPTPRGEGPPTSLPEVEADPEADGIDRWRWCKMLVNLPRLMSAKDWGGRGAELAQALVSFEESLMHNRTGALPRSGCRPGDIAEWMKRHRTGDDFAVGKGFGEGLLAWWLDIRPRDRVGPRLDKLAEGVEWPLRANPERAWVDWCRVRVGGDNGVILVVLGLTWWGQAIVNEGAGEGLGEGEAALAQHEGWQYLLADVLWAIREMTDEMEPGTRTEWEQEKAAAKAGTKDTEMSAKTKAKTKKGGKKKSAEKKLPAVKAAGKRKCAAGEDGEASDASATKPTRSGRARAEIAPPHPRPKPHRKMLIRKPDSMTAADDSTTATASGVVTPTSDSTIPAGGGSAPTPDQAGGNVAMPDVPPGERAAGDSARSSGGDSGDVLAVVANDSTVPAGGGSAPTPDQAGGDVAMPDAAPGESATGDSAHSSGGDSGDVLAVVANDFTVPAGGGSAPTPDQAGGDVAMPDAAPGESTTGDSARSSGGDSPAVARPILAQEGSGDLFAGAEVRPSENLFDPFAGMSEEERRDFADESQLDPDADASDDSEGED